MDLAELKRNRVRWSDARAQKSCGRIDRADRLRKGRAVLDKKPDSGVRCCVVVLPSRLRDVPAECLRRGRAVLSRL